MKLLKSMALIASLALGQPAFAKLNVVATTADLAAQKTADRATQTELKAERTPQQ